MLELFANPAYLVAGGALLSSPIIIHLINRMRFKRLRWAAMEFLLKAQRRMRRKLILQQLLLLAMRCLLVLLLGVLVGRLLEFGALGRLLGIGLTAHESRPTSHVVVLDDSPSMADGWRADDGTTTDPFEQAKKVLTDQIARAASEATTAQTVELVRLSDLGTTRPFGRLNAQSIEEMRTYLASYKPSTVRVSLAEGLKKARDLLAAQPGDVSKVVHVLSDLRAVDWVEDGEAIKQVMDDLSAAKVKVHMVDVAHPFRKKDDRRAPPSHDNLSITEFLPSKLVVARYDPLEFTLRVKNNGNSEMKDVRFSIRVNGDENRGGRSVVIPTLPGNQERAVKFELSFDRVGVEGAPLERFNLVTASLASDEPGGISADNVRHAVVEVRDRLPILVVEGRPGSRDRKDGDGFYLRPVFQTVLTGYGWTNGTASDLEKSDLSRYTFVLLLNVPTLSEAAVKNLEQYARAGGGVGFFLGDQVKAADYNRLLYRDGAGVFPVSLQDQPSPQLSEEEKQARRFRISQKKFLLRDPALRSHPALAGLYTDERGQPVKDAEQLERVFGFISIDRYWPVNPLGKWRDDRSVTELYCMPNHQAMADYEKRVREVADGLPVEDPQFAKFKKPLTDARDELRKLSITSEPLYRLAGALDDLLADQRGQGGPDEALLREFWANPKMADLKTAATRLRDAVKFGDPFYLVKEYGRGRVTLVTTTAGEMWTDWPTEKPGSASYTPIIKEMGNYLAGAGADQNRVVGEPIEVRLDANRYKPTARRAFVTHDPTVPVRGANAANLAPIVDLKEQSLDAEGDKLVLRFTEDAAPGGYLFTFTNLKPKSATPGDAGEAPEYKGVAANLDAAREGDLRRVARDDVTQLAPGAALHSADDPDWTKELRNKQTDLSETVWLFLALLLLLIAEQALSVKLSYHARPSDMEAAAPSAAAALRKRATAPPTVEEPEPVSA
jgi:hypothetical protein